MLIGNFCINPRHCSFTAKTLAQVNCPNIPEWFVPYIIYSNATLCALTINAATKNRDKIFQTQKLCNEQPNFFIFRTMHDTETHLFTCRILYLINLIRHVQHLMKIVIQLAVYGQSSVKLYRDSLLSLSLRIFTMPLKGMTSKNLKGLRRAVLLYHLTIEKHNFKYNLTKIFFANN